MNKTEPRTAISLMHENTFPCRNVVAFEFDKYGIPHAILHRVIGPTFDAANDPAAIPLKGV